MARRSLGTAYVEIDLDASRYTRAQQRLYKDATQTSLKIEDNFKKLGIKSAAEFDLMRAKINNSFNMIKNSSQATANDIVRAEKAKYEQLKALNEQQFGHQTTMLERLKEHWKAYAAAAVAAMYLIQKGVKTVVSLAMEQEKAEIALSAALRANNEFTQERMKNYTDFASSIQAVTKYGDEEILKLMALQKNLGVTSNRLEDATKMSIGLAAATGRDVQSMAMYIALAEQGEFTMLRRYIPALRSTTDKTEQLKIITEFAARGFEVAKEEAQTFSGGLTQLKNLFGDLQERIGNVIVKNQALRDLMEEGKKTLLEWIDKTEAWVTANQDLINQKVHEYIEGIKKVITELYDPTMNFIKLLGEGAKSIGWIVEVTHMLDILNFTMKHLELAPLNTLINQFKALSLVKKGVLSFSEIARAGLGGLEETIAKGEERLKFKKTGLGYGVGTEGQPIFRGKIGKRPKKNIPIPTPVIEKPQIDIETKLESELSRFQALQQTALTDIKSQYAQNLIDLEDYYGKRKKLLTASFEKEKEITQKLSEGESDINKKQKDLDKIFALEQKYEQDKIALAEEENKAIQKRLDDQLNASIKTRDKIVSYTSEGVEREIIEIKRGSSKELAEFKKMLDDKLISLSEYNAYKLALEQNTQNKINEITENAEKKNEENLDKMTEFAAEAARNMENAMSTFFFDLMQGKMDDLVGDFKKMIDKMVADMLASQLSEWLFGSMGKGEGGSWGAIGKIGSKLGGFLGFQHGGWINEPVMGIGQHSGRGYRMGEAGPEYISPQGAISVVNHFNISAPEGRIPRESMNQLQIAVGAGMQKALRRNG